MVQSLFFLESTSRQNACARFGKNKEENIVILYVSFQSPLTFQSYIKDFNIVELRHSFKNLKTENVGSIVLFSGAVLTQ